MEGFEAKARKGKREGKSDVRDEEGKVLGLL